MKSLLRARRSALVAALAGAAAVAGLLLIQSARHGWPFSLHHGLPSAGPEALESTPPPEVEPGNAPRASVTIESAQFERFGIRLERVQLQEVSFATRSAATVTPDESRISHVHSRVSGWVEELYVNTTGESVRVGQPLAAVFSQELFASQTEYLAALRQSAGLQRTVVLEAARTRLEVLGMTKPEIEALEREDAAHRLVTIVAPRAGVVLRRGVSVGTAIDPSTELLTIADLSRVWVIAEVPESEAAGIAVGTRAALSFPVAGAPLPSPVEFVYPTLAERTRNVRVRFTVPNADGALRPGLYGTATFDSAVRMALTVPRDAIVETGESVHVFVQSRAGVLEPRRVRLGARLGQRVEVVEGLAEGDEIVTSGVFLIDSESRLRASGTGASHVGHDAAATDEHGGHQQ